MNYFEDHIGDYAAATAHLTWDEDMAYTRLIRAYYHSEKPIPQDQTYRLARASTPAQRKAVDVVIKDFFKLDGDVYRQKRCDEEIARFKDKQAKAKRSADARWSANRSDSEGTANAMRTHSEGNAPQSPVTSNQTPIKEKSAKAPPIPCPDDVDPQVFADWVQLRKAKRATVSQTVIDEARAEAVKAGLPFERFLAVWCARGSQGMQAEWLKPHERAGSPAGNSNKYAAAARTIFGNDADNERRTIDA